MADTRNRTREDERRILNKRIAGIVGKADFLYERREEVHVDVVVSKQDFRVLSMVADKCGLTAEDQASQILSQVLREIGGHKE